MTEQKDIPPQKSALFFALMFFAWAGRAFTFQDIGRKHYGEFVVGGQAVAAGVVMLVMALWASILFFRRAKANRPNIRGPLTGFVILVFCAIGLQAALFFGGASLRASTLAMLLCLPLSWPFINGIHACVQKKQPETKRVAGSD
jgi:hypothetical protein